MTDEYILGVDFGSEYIRVSTSHINRSFLPFPIPQVVEFGGDRNLRNILMLTPEMDDFEEIGDDVFNSGVLKDAEEFIYHSLSPQMFQRGQPGKALEILLAYIHRELKLNTIPETQIQDWQTIITFPVEVTEHEAQIWKHAFASSGFPNPKVISAIAAIYYSYFQDKSVPGTYFIVDCGASRTRMAICQVGNNGDIHVLNSMFGDPGGRAFDKVISEYFSNTLAESTIFSTCHQLELTNFAEELKKTFARKWSSGEQRVEYVYQIPSEKVVLALDRDEFESSSLAGELISKFYYLAENLLEESGQAPSDIAGILLAGGGANWPFVKQWAEKLVDKSDVHLADRPEESIVRGMPYVYVNNPNVTILDRKQHSDQRILVVDEYSERILPSTPPSPRLPASKAKSPWKVFWVEFLGGLVGFLGLGWFFYLDTFWAGCLSLLGWWIVIALLVIGVIASLFNPLFLLIIIPVWIFVPLFSAIIAMRKYKVSVLPDSQIGVCCE